MRTREYSVSALRTPPQLFSPEALLREVGWSGTRYQQDWGSSHLLISLTSKRSSQTSRYHSLTTNKIHLYVPARMSRGIGIPHSETDPPIADNGMRTITAANQKMRHRNRRISRRDVTHILGTEEKHIHGISRWRKPVRSNNNSWSHTL